MAVTFLLLLKQIGPILFVYVLNRVGHPHIQIISTEFPETNASLDLQCVLSQAVTGSVSD